MRKIIMIPFANIENAKSSENLETTNNIDLYLKNCLVSCASAKKNNVDCDVAFVTNIEIPKIYESLFAKYNILIIKVEFDDFCFSKDYLWCLAFYKLCALKHILEEYDYDYYSYIDSDVFVAHSFDNIWEECKEHVLLYDINHGLQVTDYVDFLNDVSQFTGKIKYITHYGGEFFASNRINGLDFIREEKKIYSQMIETNYITTFGDEFILSIAASNKTYIKNGGAYIYRYWTRKFNLVSTNYLYNPVCIWHCPSEKKYGFIKIFNKYIIKNKKISNNRASKILHLNRPILIIRLANKFFK